MKIPETELAQLFGVDKNWLIHVADNNFTCMCKYYCGEDGAEIDHCTEWELVNEVLLLEKKLGDAKGRVASWYQTQNKSVPASSQWNCRTCREPVESAGDQCLECRRSR